MIIHLLDYISRDYAAAVENGKVINATEYQEMLEFGNTVHELVLPLAGKFQLGMENFLSRSGSLKRLSCKKGDKTKLQNWPRGLSRS